MSQGPPFGTNPYSPPQTPGQGPMPPGTVKNWLVESKSLLAASEAER